MHRTDDDVDHVDTKTPFQFQIIDWYTNDIQISADEGEEDDEENDAKTEYVIKTFGVDADGHSVSVDIKGYRPYFYVSTSRELNNVDIDLLYIYVKSKLSIHNKYDFEIDTVKKKSIWGFTNNTYNQYIQFKFNNRVTFYKVRKILSFSIPINRKNIKFKFYETNIDPLLRFIHKKNIEPAGWISIENFDNASMVDSKCQINLTVEWKHVKHVECAQTAPCNILSFDIECNSSHGDFPVAIKRYSKFVNEFLDFYKQIDHNQTIFEIKNEIFKTVLNAFQLVDLSPDVYHLSILFTKDKPDEDTILTKLTEKIDDIIAIIHDKQKNYKEILEETFNSFLPELKGDEIIQIGSTVHKYGDNQCCFKSIITLNTCDPIDGVEVISCKTEKRLIIEWCKLLNNVDPDVITGYNILGFDFEYIYQRAKENKCVNHLLKCSKIFNHKSEYIEKSLSSSALGDNILKYVNFEGRVIIDLMKVVQREYKLDSYKLDFVAKSFINGKIQNAYDNVIEVENTTGLNVGDYIYCNEDDDKCKIIEIKENRVYLDKKMDNKNIKSWGLAKDDVSPQDIFRFQKGTSKDRSIIAKYCVQDCALCNTLIMKLEIIANNCGMANVCHVPLSYIFMRGQGIKIFSLFSKQCKEDNFVIPVIKYDENVDDDNGYEGAIVLDPIPGIYVDDPISVMDYASLYPNSMISENISHDSIILDDKYDNLPDIRYTNITYDVFDVIDDKKTKVGEKMCRFAQLPNNQKSILPRILMKLLSQRKHTRKKMQHKSITLSTSVTYTGLILSSTDVDYTLLCNSSNNKITILKSDVIEIKNMYNEFLIAVLDGLQLAYKITANSLYGQVGARTSSIYMKELAASTTATGRNLILKAKAFMEDNFEGKIIYGDTDSIFVDFQISSRFNLFKEEAIQKSIEISVEASKAFKKTLPAPHDLEYEKTFWPFIILSKKKYVGNLYEFDIHKFKQKSMGIVLKRRDNANIVKLVYGGIIDILLNKQNITDAVHFLQKSLEELIQGKFDIKNLIITKTLRKIYANPERIAHKVLADRMKERDPGSAPQVNDRIPYVYIQNKSKHSLQGDKIEHPSFIIANNLQIDYIFYITNQLMKPICQLLSLALFDIPKCYKKEDYYNNKYKFLLLQYNSEKKAAEKVSSLKQKDVQQLLFDDILNELNNKKNNNRTISEFFKVT